MLRVAADVFADGQDSVFTIPIPRCDPEHHAGSGRRRTEGGATCPASTSDAISSCALALVEELRPPGQLVPGDARRTGAANDPEHPLVVGLGRIVGDVLLDLADGVIGAVADEVGCPFGVDVTDHRRRRIERHGADQRQLGGVLGDACQDGGVRVPRASRS